MDDTDTGDNGSKKTSFVENADRGEDGDERLGEDNDETNDTGDKGNEDDNTHDAGDPIGNTGDSGGVTESCVVESGLGRSAGNSTGNRIFNLSLDISSVFSSPPSGKAGRAVLDVSGVITTSSNSCSNSSPDFASDSLSASSASLSAIAGKSPLGAWNSCHELGIANLAPHCALICSC
jgi:hypothetical protein